MDFFKYVFSDDAQPQYSDQHIDPTPNPGSSSAWSFGGLMKTLTDKSESVIESYRKDFEEFGSGLKKETEIIRSVASRAVNDSLEIGASVAQEKLESVGQAIDDIGSSVWKSTAQIISHGKDTLLSPSDDDNSDSENPYDEKLNLSNSSISEKRYSRFEMQIRALQSEKSTYSTEPEDLEDFENWKLGFNFEEKKGEIEELFNENPVIADIFKEVVSDEVESNRCWCNYFYKVSRLMKAEEARAKLVKSAISGEEEDLSWDIDEDDDEEIGNVDSEKKMNLSEDGEKLSKNDEEKAGSCKDSDVSVVSSQQSMPEDEGWDEIEEIRSSDDNKGEDVGSANKVDLRKQLSVPEEEEDLGWDIDDDDDDEDQPVKA
ncbi:BSD domain-containing protein 1-like [Durio zibethinus]|uniref:BSD domain-containing protein 1-like n=1 Tax=Durio zibethinus TaxID=66656 RepID=A0A6P5X443_DURZI|nr:BSD domain-containing protein 1-like [Durio zibethinus]